MYSCNGDIQHCVKLALIGFYFVQLVLNAPRNCRQEPWSLPHGAFPNAHRKVG